MVVSSLYIALDAPDWGRESLPRLRGMLPAIKCSANQRWASVRQDVMPAYDIWVTGTDDGVAFGYRPCSEGCTAVCPALEFVMAAIHFTLRDDPDEAVCVSLDQRFVHLPCDTCAGAALREGLWSQTGADMPGEEACYMCTCGATHAIRLVE